MVRIERSVTTGVSRNRGDWTQMQAQGRLMKFSDLLNKVKQKTSEKVRQAGVKSSER